MEELLAELPSFEIQKNYHYMSRVYQPDRLSLNSSDDITNENEISNPYNYSNFTIRLQKACLNVKSLQLLRASIPTPVTNIPDTETTFWYYRIPNITTTVITDGYGNTLYNGDLSGFLFNTDNSFSTLWLDFKGNVLNIYGNIVYTYDIGNANGLITNSPVFPSDYTPLYDTNGDQTQYWILYHTDYTNNLPSYPPSPLYLQFIRLLPSLTPLDFLLNNQNYGINKTFSDYDDLVASLNLSCQRDFIQGALPPTYPSFVENDISFSYNPSNNKIVMNCLKSNDANGNFQYWYYPAGFQDKYVFNQGYTIKFPNNTTLAILPKPACQQLFNYSLEYNIDAFPEDVGLSGFLRLPQQYVSNKTLNLRLGFTYSGYWNRSNSFGIITSQAYYNFLNSIRPFPNYIQTNVLTELNYNSLSITANSYANLVNTACVYVYCDLVGGSTEDSSGNGGLLAVVPLATQNNAVGFFNNVLNAPLLKIPTQITELRIRYVDEGGSDFLLPNSAVTNLEIGLTYL